MNYFFHILNKQKYIGLVLLLFSASVFATSGHIYLGGTLGASMARLGNKTPQISYDDGNLTDAYPSNGGHSTVTVVGANVGYEFVGSCFKPAIAFGLGVYDTPTEYGYHGQVIETALGDPSNALYQYNYNINSVRIMAEAKLTWMIRQFAPYIDIGVGPVWNHMNGYTETSVDSIGYVALPPFRSHTNMNLAYQAGLGVGYMFNFVGYPSNFMQERISVGYRYANLGDANFGTRSTTYPYQLDTGKLKTNDVYLTYTHLF